MRTAGIIAALPAESHALPGPWLRLDEENRTVRSRTMRGGVRVLSVTAGMGQQKAEQAAQWLVGQGAVILMSTGVAGGLRPGLRSGDLVIADSVRSQKGNRQIESRKADRQHASLSHALLIGKGMSVYRGPLASVSRPALDARAKGALFGRTQALAVDTESAAIARIAREAKIPFFVLRSICDPVEHSVHSDLPGLIDDGGRLRAGQFLRMVLRDPHRTADLVSMRKCFKGALASLGEAWRVLMQYGVFGETALPSRGAETAGNACRKRKMARR